VTTGLSPASISSVTSTSPYSIGSMCALVGDALVSVNGVFLIGLSAAAHNEVACR
jgi:hypothetical protein